ncbi:hypothetical protein CERZMDRAFT_95593 [Cercospora zeae-maydis SCOH1-5]|uniref:Uncharacterized protein n=1 Tax=Cercospora zeae-maydis SCOH1-5 TaxID=717836 RepID=A0A6A6FM94_9PEZI|nr:hypothetical protein CERZMDRAFT_95593 [Cercospora zeae-maydis SCOH1-5]
MGELSPFCAKAAPLPQRLVQELETTSETSEPGSGRPHGRLVVQRDSAASNAERQPYSLALENSHDTVPGVANLHSLLNHDAPVTNNDSALDWNTLLTEIQPHQWISPAEFPLGTMVQH